MKPKKEQLSLFDNLAPSYGHDRIEHCSRCGREIVVVHYTKDGSESDYQSRDGKCYICTFGAKG